MRYARRTKTSSSSIFDVIIEHLSDPEMISFSGGFPATDLLPHHELKLASQIVFENDQALALQYSSTWGYEPLRQWIAKRYQDNYHLNIQEKDILITTGSQQAIDLIGKVFLDPQDSILVESPSYLGALQSFQQFEPIIHAVSLNDNGMDINHFSTVLSAHQPKLIYAVPNFQNPSGICYTLENRQQIVEIMKNHDVVFIEDDPYGELRYEGIAEPHFKSLAYDQTILLGSFSKIIAPGLRLGWISAQKDILDKLYSAKEACDLHSSNLDQRIVYEYLMHHSIDDHISEVKDRYQRNRLIMLDAIQNYFPSNIHVSKSLGGMFLWCSGPKHLDVNKLFEQALKIKVLIMPGEPFYANNNPNNTFRLNYTNVDETQIKEGIARLGKLIKELL